MSDELKTDSFFNPKVKKKRKTLTDPDGLGISIKQRRLLAKLPEMMEGKKTMAQIAIESGFCRDTHNAGMVGDRELTKLKKQLSKNDALMEAFNLNGASIEDAAKTMAEMLNAKMLTRVNPHAGNIEGVREVPDNKVRNNAAQFIIAAHGAMPEKKLTVETRSFEEKLSIVKIIQQNPEEALKLIHQKMTGTIVEAEVVEETEGADE